MDRDPVHVAVDQLHLAGVQAGANVEPEVLHRVADRARAVDRARRPVERRERAVAGELDDCAPRAGVWRIIQFDRPPV
jgi:hypothetical protein